ncbi:MAG TPA: thiamine pyrophosphate-binding protein, partial [Azospirillaceae bacterium]|nr:thiamine pyrophosphate-binding protein [Azospirillaceae bacterium]
MSLTPPRTGPRTGGQLLVEALTLHGADLVFGVPGESYLEVLDALVDVPAIRYVLGRQEGGVAFMAEAYGKLTGRPGVAFVTRGPGACNAAIGIHTAFQDSTPMILFVGQVAREQAEREAFQEIDYRRMFGPIAKWAAEINQAGRIPEFVARAFHVATSGRPGPVVLALPEDMLREAAQVAVGRPYAVTEPHPAPADVAALADRLARAERPMVLVGGGGWSDRAAADLKSFVEAWQLPVCCSFRRHDVLDNTSPGFIGELALNPNPKLLERVRVADLL